VQQLIRRLARSTRPLRGERGASAVVVALVLIPVLGVVALAVDGGALYYEKAKLQNGADAAALAVAARCARGLPTCSTTAYGSDVGAVADQNDDVDGLQTVSAVAFPGGTGSSPVLATTRTRTSGGGGLRHPFVSALNAALGQPDSAATFVTASATASWSAPSSAADVLPLAFSLCGLQSALSSGTKILLRSDNNNGSTSCSAADGHPIAGGFGWLDGTTCSSTLSVNGLAASDQGNDLPSRCNGLISPEQLIGRVIEVPIFDCAASAAGTCLTQVGNHTGTQKVDRYRIYGFAAFKVAGHRLTGTDMATDASYTGSLRCTGNCRGIQGTFVRWNFTGPTSQTPGPDLGAAVVRLTR